jgi:hypothetical protein
MIVQQSRMTGLAGLKVGVQASACPARLDTNRGRKSAVCPICRICLIHSPSDLHFHSEFPNPNSTLRHPKSTVELGYKPLNWGENTLRTPLTTILARSKPLRMQAISASFRNQTEIKPNQAGKFFPTVDLGCLKSSSLVAAKQSEDGPSTGFDIRVYRLATFHVVFICLPRRVGTPKSDEGGSAAKAGGSKKALFAKRTQLCVLQCFDKIPTSVQGSSNPVQPNPSQSNTSREKMVQYPCSPVAKKVSFAKRTQFPQSSLRRLRALRAKFTFRSLSPIQKTATPPVAGRPRK